MKKNKLNKKKVYVTLGIILLIITIGLSYGRYAYNGIKDFYLASKNFYFNSDKLKQNRAIYQIDNWSGVDPYLLTINLNNSKNNLVHANTDIDYEISYVCSLNALCSTSKTNGTLYEDSITDYFTALITPNAALQNDDEVWMEITVKSTYPYKKSLSARFIFKVGIPGISYAIDDV